MYAEEEKESRADFIFKVQKKIIDAKNAKYTMVCECHPDSKRVNSYCHTRRDIGGNFFRHGRDSKADGNFGEQRRRKRCFIRIHRKLELDRRQRKISLNRG